MGYADTAQIGTGLRQRLYSRAFLVGSPTKPSERFVYLVLDTATGDTAVRNGIIEGVAALGSGYSAYSRSYIAVTGTHSHSGPGAWLNYLLPQITSKGFDKQSYRAIVDGAVLSIKRAHESLAPGHLSFGTTKVTNANINRSLYAYLANPAAERAKYANGPDDDGSTEKDLTLLKFEKPDGKAIGVLTWYPTHGTSMLGNNTLVTGDNKGVAAYLFEKSMGSGFVAGFSQANVGDVSPNILGAWCEDGSNQMCSFENSTCADGKSQACHARGPFFRVKDNGASSCFEIGKRQADAAKGLLDNWTGTDVQGNSVKAFHLYHDMSTFSFPLANGTVVKTCPAALGYSFAAGTTDGPGVFDFTQGDSGKPNANPIWKLVSGFLKPPSKEQMACQWPKPVLLDVGRIRNPYAWTANIVDIQVLRVGQLFIIVAPGEATTMTGRRWREAVAAEASKQGLTGGVQPKVVLGGPANTYAHYITTQEEYSRQRYEGASTLYGQWTSNAYIHVTLQNLKYLSPSASSGPPSGPLPPDNRENSLNLITGVVYDSAPIGKKFGDVRTNVSPSYTAGQTVSVTFIGANPRNNLRLEGTYAAVEKQHSDGSWTRIRSDEDWDLIYNWKRVN
ncbi:MAG: neutral/alkaline ceramidase, partial [Leuconostoc sp.]|nr:neutral/alkaline ceramidase [Leuconostoc sp.]